MTQYNLTLSPSELETIHSLINHTIDKLEPLVQEVDDILDEPISTDQYNLYLSTLATITKDMANMRSILVQLESVQ